MFSVVIPVYNHAPYVGEAVRSALESDLVSEVLVCDDGSSDGSARVLAEIARSDRRVRNLTDDPPVNRGAHERLNQLCREARGEYLAVLNSDDRFVPGRFEVCRRLLAAGAEFVCGHLLIIDPAGRTIGSKRGVLQPEYPYPDGMDVAAMARRGDLLTLLASQNFIATTSNMVFTRRLFDAIGGFADLRYAHDYEFALRAAVLAEGRCSYVPQFFTAYRVHASNTITEGGSRERVWAELRGIFERVLAEYPFLASREAFLRAMRHRPAAQGFDRVRVPALETPA